MKGFITDPLMNNRFFPICLLAMVAAAPSIAHAEGGNISISGVHGVIRIVRTTTGQGYKSTAGTMTMSFFHPVNVQGAVDKTVDPLYDKPQVYLGATPVLAVGGTTEVEGGLSAELGSWGTSVTGWGGFMAKANGGAGGGNMTVNPKIWSGDPTNPNAVWRSGTYQTSGDTTSGAYSGVSGSITSTLTFNVYTPGDGKGGSYAMTISGLGDAKGNQTFFFNTNDPIRDSYAKAGPDSQNVMHYVAPWGGPMGAVETSNDQTQCRVKHEIAQTRGTSQAIALGDSALDGSWVSSAWSFCTVNGATWTAGMTDQTATGFNAPANQGDVVYDKLYSSAKTPGSHTIVEFPSNNVSLRAGSQSANDNPGDPNRYASETCVVNLGTAARPLGDAVSW